MLNDANRVKEIFLEAADQPDEAARAAYLDRACGGDAGLRDRVEALLRSHDPAGSFLGSPAVKPTDLNGATQELGVDQGATPDDDANGADDLQFLSPSTRPDSLGRLGHYEMLQVLGRGGFGIVFRAFDDVLQRVVAVKVMAPQIATLSPARKRFLREARSSAAVRHENVVHVYEVGEQPLPYLVMEFVPGETLQQKLDRSGPLEVSEVLRIGRQIAEGLAAAHASDLIHRDIKPANILLEGGSQKVKITDFGLARAADDASISQSGVIAGTPMFMAPEQALGQEIDQRADLFSFGSVLYQMVSGRPPFRAPSALAVLKRVAEESPRPIPEIIPETPAWLCEIIAKLHAKNPEDRFQSAREIADVLADCEAQLKAHDKVKDFSRIPRGKPQRSGRWKWAAAAAVLMLPVIALAATEFAGVTHLFRGQQAMPNPSKPVGGTQAKATAAWNDWPADAPEPAIAPFDAAQASAHREAWAKYLKVPVEYTNSLGMKFGFIPPGKFMMGSPQPEIDRCIGLRLELGNWFNAEAPEHEVEITQPFCLGSTEVTVGQFRQFVEEEKYQAGDDRWQKPGFEQADDHPVVWVSWQNAVDFCTWLSEKEGKKYRLPTEAEWEYSCRAGKGGTRYCFGNEDADLGSYAWYEANSGGKTQSVGKLRPNDWGLYDMHGNAWEWCQDYYDPKYYTSSPKKDPPGGVGDSYGHVFRGGSWFDAPVSCRSAFRPCQPPGHRDRNLGFRVSLSVNAVKQAVTLVPEEKKTPSPVEGKLAPTFTNTIGMEFVIVPKGKSWLGGGKDKLADRGVEIPADFYLGKYEVTQEEWEKVMGENPSSFSRTGGGKDAVKDVSDADLKRFPVEHVSWDDCQLFVAKLNKQEREAGWVYRLPKNSEWEYACRGGPMADKRDGAFDYYFTKPTNTLLPDQANFNPTGLERPCKVGSFAPNALGVFDMHGNVAEWCDEPWTPLTRILHGGCWADDSGKCTAVCGGIMGASGRNNAYGLRMARVPSGAP